MILPAFPLGSAFLPGDAVTLRIFEERYKALAQDLSHFNNSFVTVLIAAGSEVGGNDTRFDTGVVVHVEHLQDDDMGYKLFGTAGNAVHINEWLNDNAYPTVHVHTRQYEMTSPTQCLQMFNSLQESLLEFFTTAQNLGAFNGDIAIEEQLIRSMTPSDHVHEMHEAIWGLAKMIPCDALAKYHMLRCSSIDEVLSVAGESLDHLSDLLQFRFGT